MEVSLGGITTPRGFLASGVACGLKNNGNKDLALVYSKRQASAAGVFTTNMIKGHSLLVTLKHINNGNARAVLINSGNANACVGLKGIKDALEMSKTLSEVLKCDKNDILLASTGVIGIPLNLDSIKCGIQSAFIKLNPHGGTDAAKAIMTTDTIPKEAAISIEIDGIKVNLGGMAKGSGMIHPNMATMIGLITTDINISPKMLSIALKRAVAHTFNRISVDGDTSVCDTVLILANGACGNTIIDTEDQRFSIFTQALEKLCAHLAKLIVMDGEGATKLIDIRIYNAPTEKDAYKAALAIAKSPLVKTAIFGEDANWGRIITALGYSGAVFDPDKVDIFIDNLKVCKDSTAVSFDEDRAKRILSKDEILLKVDLKIGTHFDRYWTCDFSYDYIKINGSYRT